MDDPAGGQSGGVGEGGTDCEVHLGSQLLLKQRYPESPSEISVCCWDRVMGNACPITNSGIKAVTDTALQLIGISSVNSSHLLF